MELTVRDLMVIVGVLLIMAVLLDAYRRVRRDRRDKVRVSMTKQVEGESSPGDEDLSWLKELPNGGGRVVDRSGLLQGSADVAEDYQAHDGDYLAEQEESEESVAFESEDVPLVEGMSSTEAPENLDWLDGLDVANVSEGADDEPARMHRTVDPEVFMVNVVSRDAVGFNGEDILHILLACDLRFGDMNFFHRHELEAGRGPIQFSVANMIQPGVFDLDNMTDMKTPGLVFFLTLPGPENMMQAFDYMLETAQAVARNLGGDLLDETRSVMTRQTLDHARQKIVDLERRMLTTAPS